MNVNVESRRAAQGLRLAGNGRRLRVRHGHAMRAVITNTTATQNYKAASKVRNVNASAAKSHPSKSATTGFMKRIRRHARCRAVLQYINVCGSRCPNRTAIRYATASQERIEIEAR